MTLIENTTTTFKAGSYLRHSYTLGAKAQVPAIVEITNGDLIVKTASAVIVNVPAKEVTARFNRFGTLILATPRGKYRFNSSGNVYSAEFSAEQLSELTNFSDSTDQINKALLTASASSLFTRGSGGAIEGAGLLLSAISVGSSVVSTNRANAAMAAVFREGLAANGIPVAFKKANALNIYMMSICAGLAIFVVLVAAGVIH